MNGPSRLSRRDFITAGGSAVAASVLAPSISLARPQSRTHGRSRGRGIGREKMRMAVVGLGIRGITMWGRSVAREYGDHVEIVGLCDINPGRLEHGKNYIGVECPTFTDFDEMMDAVEPDVVTVTTVDDTHDRFIIGAMERGADVITEKPMTTDEAKCQAIIDAQDATGRSIIVTHNYRYSPHRVEMKEMLMNGRIGEVRSVDFHWYLDIYHGASYFRRWHGKEEYSGSLFVHKASHHYDLLNWWLDSEPETVFANAALEYYGHNNDFRHTNCRGCPHQNECRHYWDITESDFNMALYVANEHHDGYLRDGCVWDDDIDIFDKMAAQITYANDVVVSYSCTTYSPYEGYRIAFNGTDGRLEAWIKEAQPWEAEDYDEIRVTDNFGETELIRVPHTGGGHGGGDVLLKDRIFVDPDMEDPYRQAADMRQGAMAVLPGIAARQSARSGESVEIATLTSLVPQAVRP